MTKEFNWWVRDPEIGKYEVSAAIHGDAIRWQRHERRFESWIEHEPTAADWDRLVKEAEERVPRRLISPKQLEMVKQLRAKGMR